MITTLLMGLLTGLGLIVAIGAQNAWVLRQGLARDRVLLVVSLCALSDVVLIVAGTAGMGAVVSAHPDVLRVLVWCGAAYLVWFGIRSLRSARRPGALQEAPARSGSSIVATTLALTFLNPHVYLDTVLMLGNLAAAQGSGRWVYAAGAGLGSILWFSLLGFGARSLSRLFARARTWQILDTVIGVTMFGLAGFLVASAPVG